ncbi:MAG: DUF2057 domain-containing protein [Gammaproteobacteria bacterium]|nr:DUF2057 domain-containing protein [Gammaproteobacteria bacterium]MDH5727733.1 DUF2057 domain-containing protein [Gammaproteobacteria bacterium]
MISVRKSSLVIGILTFALIACTPRMVVFAPEKIDKLNQAQQVYLQVPIAVDLMFFDGRKQNTLPYALHYRELHFKPGAHQLIFQYHQLWEDDMQNHEVIRSQALSVEMQFTAGQRYALSYPPVENIEQARLMRKQFEFKILDESGQVLAQGQPVAIMDISKNELSSKNDSCCDWDNSSNNYSSEALPQLKQWWDKASAQDKKAFKDYIDLP